MNKPYVAEIATITNSVEKYVVSRKDSNRQFAEVYGKSNALKVAKALNFLDRHESRERSLRRAIGRK